VNQGVVSRDFVALRRSIFVDNPLGLPETQPIGGAAFVASSVV
jgi:hypothetical protein